MVHRLRTSGLNPCNIDHSTSLNYGLLVNNYNSIELLIIAGGRQNIPNQEDLWDINDKFAFLLKF